VGVGMGSRRQLRSFKLALIADSSSVVTKVESTRPWSPRVGLGLEILFGVDGCLRGEVEEAVVEFIGDSFTEGDRLSATYRWTGQLLCNGNHSLDARRIELFPFSTNATNSDVAREASA
jgi:hypothetical protein